MKHTLFTTSLIALGLAAGAAQAQTVLTSSDGIIRNSLCVGSDCQSGISFSDSTIILKENNTRLKFADTSTGSFPNRDWELEANSQTNGGTNHFALLDCGTSSNDGGCTSPRNVFTVEASAPNHALYVDDGGRIGLGTSSPVVELHAVDGDSPTLRLEQDGSSGFAPQIWDVAGNETSFFIRDATAGSTLPFRIMSGGAPSGSLVIDDTGNVGIGAGNIPDAALHVQRATGAAAGLLTLENNGGSFITISNTTSGRDWFFTHENAAQGRFIINASTNPADGLFLDPDGDMTIGGTLTENSDKNAKMAIVPVDTAAILDKVSTLPVSAWTYKDDTSGARHVGPMAQDFYAAFGLGHTDKGIATLDTSGIALASIKALHDENQALQEENKDLRAHYDAQLATQTAQIAVLMERLDKLAAQ